MGLIEYAEQELKAIGMWDSDDEMDQLAVENIMELVRIFADQEHSGFSASYVRDVVHRLFAYEPLVPLTGEDEEWMDVGGGLWQNKRAYNVFKNEDGAFDAEGRVFVQPNGTGYTGPGSKVDIEFPYIPDPEYVHVDDEGNVLDPQPEEV